jgi:hypothetical protein
VDEIEEEKDENRYWLSVDENEKSIDHKWKCLQRTARRTSLPLTIFAVPLADVPENIFSDSVPDIKPLIL